MAAAVLLAPRPRRGGQAARSTSRRRTPPRAGHETQARARVDGQGADGPAPRRLRSEARRRPDDGDGASETTAAATAAGGKKVKSKTYTFGAMDVEGKLKTPQLLYFLNSVKLELDMSAPDKRSFMKELQQSADDKNL